MKDFNAYIAKQITAAAMPKQAAKRNRKAIKEYKHVCKLIYHAAKHGTSHIYVNFYPLELEVNEWLKQEGFQIEYLGPFLNRVSWD